MLNIGVQEESLRKVKGRPYSRMEIFFLVDEALSRIQEPTGQEKQSVIIAVASAEGCKVLLQ